MITHETHCASCADGEYCAAGVIIEARYAAFLAMGGETGTAAGVDAAIGVVLDRLLDLFGGAVDCRSADELTDMERGYGEALDWTCMELQELRETR